MDRVSRSKRSEIMASIKGKDTQPEMRVRTFLHNRGLRYKLHDKNLPGRPDLVFPRYKTVLFVQGCFWHGHKGCKYFRLPKSNVQYWKNKILTNRERDERNIAKLQEMSWNVLQVWECETKDFAILESLAIDIRDAVRD